MPKDKYSAVWVSHSSIRDFLTCPRAYYLNNVYKDPQTGNKIQIISPPLALGQAVHEVIESLSVLPTDQRFDESIFEKYDSAWEKISGKSGGFQDNDQEQNYKKSGEEMIRKVKNNPGPLVKKAVKIKMDLPNYWISEEDNIILCGKIDWIEYLPDTDSVHIIDFKTSRNVESEDSLQLPIYHLLAANCQKRPIDRASYWYLRNRTRPTQIDLPDLEESKEKILKIAKKIKLARQLEKFDCPEGEDGCYACRPLEAVLKGNAEKVGTSEYNQDVYIVEKEDSTSEPQSEIL